MSEYMVQTWHYIISIILSFKNQSVKHTDTPTYIYRALVNVSVCVCVDIPLQLVLLALLLQ